MNATFAYARFELVRTLRDSRFVFFLIAMPGVLYLLYGGLGTTAAEDGLAGPAARMVALATYAAMGGALYCIGPALAAERASGWIRQLRVTPLSRRNWLIAKALQSAVMTLPGVLVVIGLGVVLRSVHTSPWHLGAAIVVLLVGALPFALIGLVIGQALDGQAANSATLLFLIVTSFVGGIFVPTRGLPGLARGIGDLFPSAHLGALARDALAGAGLPVTDIAVLGAWAVGAAVAAVALSRRDQPAAG
jgi:ABC-2 type transport system permease protein